MDKDIWKNARTYIKKHDGITGGLLPVLDKEYHLICFAYEDRDANREIRMLRELSDLSGAVQFSDIYSQYKCVKIYEFNELAYFCAEYLRSQNIAVKSVCEVPEYECLTVYAEGVQEKSINWKENLLRSVSVEFEFIDKVYEANISKGIIKNAKEDCEVLLENLRNGKEIIILGTGRNAQNAYDFMVENGIDNFSEFFSYTISYINIEEKKSIKYSIRQLIPKRIALGSIEDCSGNNFFKGFKRNTRNVFKKIFF